MRENVNQQNFGTIYLFEFLILIENVKSDERKKMIVHD
jgi:hypothetical protein